MTAGENAAAESLFSSLKTERVARKTYRNMNEAAADVIDYIKRFYNLRCRHSILGYLSPTEYEKQATLAHGGICETRGMPSKDRLLLL